MDIAIAFAWPFVAFAAIMGAVITWDRRRKTRRDPRRVSPGVVNRWEAADAIRAGNTLLATGAPEDQAKALGHFTVAVLWLQHEHRHGSDRRKARLEALLNDAILGQRRARAVPKL